ncbi:Thiol-disulfide oxidoreductase ResA [Anaerohalosphaera lusitana]|uniref:Thiol-disulfide oxidoreductase ResA n=1 Tax=Anaerohalosphaera lusitana TaxID=1936003 RepID=A0A1U9NIH6_9BACT|nr:TlpA disulfide reductase family protein [Anaerohalosphaera lusitana]AQT67721.1 Thiol-disulfide oxidoreductase ResA [Anaerohalosphaera lusitana]
MTNRNLLASFIAAILLIIVILFIIDKGPYEEAQPQEAQAEKEPQTQIDKVIADADTWAPIFEQWYGKPAPELELTDITGETHNLSDYKGTNVVLVFWATWCPPCKMEIPHLKALREEMSKDELMILAISNEADRTVKSFAEQENLNYTVIATDKQLPKPYSLVTGIPTSIYLDKQGNIKLATQGLVNEEHARAIILAE